MPSHEYRYVPILRAKQGEFNALGQLDATVKSSITPLIEVQGIADPGTKTLDDHYETIARELEKNWGVSDAVFVEDDESPDDGETTGGGHPLDELFKRLHSRNVQAVPVTGVSRTPAYQSAVQRISAATKRLCLRLEPEDLNDPAALTTKVDELLRAFGLAPLQVDLLLDFGGVTSEQVGLVELVLSTTVPLLPHLKAWRSFTIAMTSFPERLSDHVRTGSTERLPRGAWHLWQRLVARPLPRTPDYSDYAVDNPETNLDLPPQLVGARMTATIRYSTENDWLVVRGTNLRKDGYEQYHDLSAQLVAEPEFKGAAFSAGDKYIADCAIRTTGTGNPRTWRQVAVNHHLTLVVEQLTNLP